MDEKRHLFLYAKGWYKRDHALTDLKVICSHITGMEVRYMDNNTLIYWIVECIKPVAMKNPVYFDRIVTGWYKGDNIFDNLLGLMSILSVEELGGHLGDPDYNILPKP